jgi:hypothetical protein
VVIAGIGDDGVPHPLTLRLWSDDDHVDETVQLPDLVNNAGTRFDFAQPVNVDVGTSYHYLVRNDSASDVSFYLKPVGANDIGVTADSAAHIVGHRNMAPDYQAPGWALSGCAEALR